MLETSARLLRLLSLLQTHRDWTGAELAERLGVTPRTVRRDVDKLRGLGYPVHATPGVAGGYQLGAGAALPPLLLDDEEAVAVAAGLRTAAVGGIAGIEEASVRALAKLEQVLPSRLRPRVDAFRTVTVPMAPGGPAVDPETLTLIATASRDHQRLRFDYESYDGASSVRTVEPHQLVHGGRRCYLVAWDVERADWRTFRVDRLRPRIPTGPRFTPREPPDPDIAGYTARGISTRQYRYQAKLTMYASAEQVADRITPLIGQVEPIDDNRCVLRSGADDLDQLAVWISLIGFDFDVLEPPELVERIRELAGRLGRTGDRTG